MLSVFVKLIVVKAINTAAGLRAFPRHDQQKPSGSLSRDWLPANYEKDMQQTSPQQNRDWLKEDSPSVDAASKHRHIQ